MRPRTTLLATAAVLAAALVAAPASAATIILYPTDGPLPAGQFMIEDFDHPIASGFTFLSNGYIRSGALGASNASAPPPGDLTNYETLEKNKVATLTSANLLKSFSFYLGSPDVFNYVRFTGPGYVKLLQGAQIFGGVTGAAGDQSWGRRVSYDFGQQGISKIEFISTNYSFEFDSLAGSFLTAVVPEPSTWAMMLLGFAGMGAMLRRRSAAAAFA